MLAIESEYSIYGQGGQYDTLSIRIITIIVATHHIGCPGGETDPLPITEILTHVFN